MAASTIILRLMGLLLWGEVAFVQLSEEEQQKSFILADVGHNVTLKCFFYQHENIVFLNWYKQLLGDKPEQLDSQAKPSGEAIVRKRMSDPRFTVVSQKGMYNLQISDVQLSDSAMYYCVFTEYDKNIFKKGIMLLVKGSSSSIQAIVQEPPEKSVHPGDSVTLNCTVHTEPCAGEEHSVYWFRHSEKSQPVFFYTHDQGCEIANTTQGSFYNFSMKNLRLSDAGTYYCAVASCGKILYGNGTRLGVECTVDRTMVHCLGVVLFISITLVIVLSSIIYKLKREKHLHSSASPTNTVDQNEDNLHYAALSLNKKRRSRPQRNNMENETVYAGVRVTQ